jgi:hypothetical protein
MANEIVHANGGTGTSIARQGFGETSLEKRSETSTSAEAARAQAETNARYIMALQRPRDPDQVRVRLLRECSRPSFATRAYFSVQRGNKPGRMSGTPNRIEGLSVRFAEAAIRTMGNLMVTTRSVYDDDEKRIVAVNVTDLETNAGFGKDVVVSKTVERRKLQTNQLALRTRTNSYGDTIFIVEATDDEMLQKENALVSKTLRTEGLRLLSADTIEECEQKIIETVRNEDAKDPDAARKALADGFAGLNVMPADLKAYLGHDLAQCSPAQLSDLRGLYAAIREGETTWAEILADNSPGSDQSTATGTTTGDQPAGGQPAATEAPKGRGSRLAGRVRASGGTAQTTAVAGTASTETPPAQPTPTAQPSAAPIQQPTSQTHGTPKTAAPAQVDFLGSQPTTQQAVQAQTQPTTAQVTTPAPHIVVPPAAKPQVTDDERQQRLQAQVSLKSNWPNSAGVPVIVELAGNQTLETHTTTMARMHGEIAVVNVDGIDGPVALTQLTRITK